MTTSLGAVTRTAVSRPLAALWITIAVQVVGRAIDAQWHLTHDDFEGAADQIRAHLVLWIGVAMSLGVSAIVVARSLASNAGYVAVLLGALFYIPVAIWHFVEHANGTDPELAHVLLGIGQAAMLLGALAAAFLARQTAPSSTAGR